MNHVKDAPKNVSLGNLNIAVKRYSEDKIGDLADSFSRMVTAGEILPNGAEAVEPGRIARRENNHT